MHSLFIKKINLSPVIFVFPALALFAIIYFLPLLVAFGMSFVEWDGLRPPLFIGFQNYVRLFHDLDFLNSVIVNIKVVVISLITQLPLALFLAYLLNQISRGYKFYQVLLFVPQMLSVVAVGILWSLIYNPYYGPFSVITKALGLSSIDWLGTPSHALFSLLLTTTWVYFGFHMVLQMAGMSAIPNELYDSAKLDTENKFLVFYYITLPLLRETLLVSAIMIFSGSFSHLLGLFWMMTRGGPNRGTELIAIFMYKQAFTSHQFGYANAIAVVMFIFLAITVAIIVLQVSKTRIEY